MTVEVLSQKLTEYASLVAQCRAEQDAFFQTRDYNRLRSAKALEQRVDKATAVILQSKPQPTQQNLFS